MAQRKIIIIQQKDLEVLRKTGQITVLTKGAAIPTANAANQVVKSAQAETSEVKTEISEVKTEPILEGTSQVEKSVSFESVASSGTTSTSEVAAPVTSTGTQIIPLSKLEPKFSDDSTAENEGPEPKRIKTEKIGPEEMKQYMHLLKKPKKLTATGDIIYEDEFVRSYHNRETNEKSHMCLLCNAVQSQRNNIKRHLRRIHDTEWKYKDYDTKCIHPDCNETFRQVRMMVKHVQQKHPEYNFEEHNFEFESLEVFEEWKSKIEEQNFLYFVKHSVPKNKLTQGLAECTYYSCQKHGHEKSHRRKGEAWRKTNRKKKIGTCKLNDVCPASIRLVRNKSSPVYKVRYMPYHTHEISINDTAHHPVPKPVKDRIKTLILEGKSEREILDSLSEWRFGEGPSCLKSGRPVNIYMIAEMKRKMLKKLAEEGTSEESREADVEVIQESDLPTMDWSNLELIVQSPENSPVKTALPSLEDTCNRAATSISKSAALGVYVPPAVRTEVVETIPCTEIVRPLNEFDESAVAVESILPHANFSPPPPPPKRKVGRPRKYDYPAQGTATNTVPTIHSVIQPLSWLLGKWRSENGRGIYPTVRDFTYGEEAHFYHSGQPMLQFSFKSWHSETRNPLHLETGFLRIQPGTNRVALIAAHNTGLAELSEGEMDGQSFEVESHTCGRLSFGMEPAVQKINRKFYREGDTLTQIVSMETSRTEMSEHLRITYQKLSDVGSDESTTLNILEGVTVSVKYEN